MTGLNDGTSRVHRRFGFPAVLETRRPAETRDPESGKPRTEKNRYDVTVRVAHRNQPTRSANPTGDSTNADVEVRFSRAELERLGAWPREDDRVLDSRPVPVGGDEYDILQTIDRETDTIVADAQKVNTRN